MNVIALLTAATPIVQHLMTIKNAPLDPAEAKAALDFVSLASGQRAGAANAAWDAAPPPKPLVPRPAKTFEPERITPSTPQAPGEASTPYQSGGK